MIYITANTRIRLLSLCEKDKRKISSEVEYLIDRRFKELDLPEMTPPSVKATIIASGNPPVKRKAKDSVGLAG